MKNGGFPSDLIAKTASPGPVVPVPTLEIPLVLYFQKIAFLFVVKKLQNRFLEEIRWLTLATGAKRACRSLKRSLKNACLLVVKKLPKPIFDFFQLGNKKNTVK